MAKQGEINYLKNLGQEGIQHSIHKPFSDIDCGEFLIGIGVLISIMPPPPRKVLDLGCGTGWTSVFYARTGYEVVGVDISDDCICHAKNQKEDENLGNLDFLVCDYENLRFVEEFDVAVFFDSLHHAEDEHLALEMAYKSLKKGGICIASEPGTGHSHQQTSIHAVERFNVTEKDMPAKRIIQIAKQIGFRKFKVLPHQSFLSKGIYNDVLRDDGSTLLKPRIIRDLAKYIKIVRFNKKKNSITLLQK